MSQVKGAIWMDRGEVFIKNFTFIQIQSRSLQWNKPINERFKVTFIKSIFFRLEALYWVVQMRKNRVPDKDPYQEIHSTLSTIFIIETAFGKLDEHVTSRLIYLVKRCANTANSEKIIFNNFLVMIHEPHRFWRVYI